MTALLIAFGLGMLVGYTIGTIRAYRIADQLAGEALARQWDEPYRSESEKLEESRRALREPEARR